MSTRLNGSAVCVNNILNKLKLNNKILSLGLQPPFQPNGSLPYHGMIVSENAVLPVRGFYLYTVALAVCSCSDTSEYAICDRLTY